MAGSGLSMVLVDVESIAEPSSSFEGVASMAGSGLSMALVDVESIADPSSSLLATTELSAATAGVTGIVSGGAPASGAVVS